MEQSFDNDKFISLVQARPCLWDTAENDYSNKNKKQQCWVEIAKKMLEGFDELPSTKQNDYGKDLQKKWKNLRNCFARELCKQKTKKSGSGTTWKTYIYFDQMSFLMKCVTNKETIASIESGCTEQDSAEEENNSQKHYETPQSKRKRVKLQKEADPNSEVLEIIKGSLQQREVYERQLHEDDDRNFLLSLLGDFKKIHPERKVDLKMEFLQALKRASNPVFSHFQPSTFPIARPYPPTYPSYPNTSQFFPHIVRNENQEGYHYYSASKNAVLYGNQQSDNEPVPSISRKSPSPDKQCTENSVASPWNSEDSQILDLLTPYN